jgi:hypothetical protein
MDIAELILECIGTLKVNKMRTDSRARYRYRIEALLPWYRSGSHRID